jgi:nitroreductase
MAIAALEARHTYRAYDPSFTIPRDQLDTILHAALISPTGRNQQEIDLITVVNRQKIDELSDVIIAGWPEDIRSSRTARVTAFGVKNVLSCDASALIFLVRNERAAGPMVLVDAGIILMSIAIAAKSLGLDSMILGLVAFGDKAKTEAALGIPTGSLEIAIAVGKAISEAGVVFNKEIIAKSTIIE